MAYGSIKVDNIIFTNGGADETTTVSGIYKAITSGVTVSGTISGTTIQGQTISGATVTGTTIQGVSGTFTSLTGVTTTGTTANFVTHNGASGVFTTLVSGATVTGTTAQFTNITGVGIGATTITGTTVTGTTANFVSGVFTTQISGATVTGTTASFTSGVFTALSGTTTTVTSGIFGAGSVTAPSVAVGTGTTYAPGIYSPGTDQVAISTNGVERVEFGTSEVVFNDGHNNYDFRIESDNNANLFFVDASVDRLGIGHANPATLVHIADTLAGSPVTTRIENFSSSANSDAVIELKTPNETYGLKANRSGARLDLDIGGTPKISITTGGLVGIGTTTVSEKLHVDNGGNDVAIRLSRGAQYGTFGADSTGIGVKSAGADPLYFSVNGTERFRISNDGSFSSVIPGGSTLYPSFDCRAWVNFNGTGTVAIRASGNVSSITDNGVGDYTVNFTTAMADTNFVSVCHGAGGTPSNTGNYNRVLEGSPNNTSSVRCIAYAPNNTAIVDLAYCSVAIFR